MTKRKGEEKIGKKEVYISLEKMTTYN